MIRRSPAAGRLLERLRTEDEKLIIELEKRYFGKLSFRAELSLHAEQFKIYNGTNNEELARNVLLEQVKQNALTPYNWASLESVLAGDRLGFQSSVYDPSLSGVRESDLTLTHISYGNQNLYSAPPAGGLTADQINAQSALIDQLLAVAKDPAGIQVLERSRQLLARRSGQVAKTAPNQ